MAFAFSLAVGETWLSATSIKHRYYTPINVSPREEGGGALREEGAGKEFEKIVNDRPTLTPLVGYVCVALEPSDFCLNEPVFEGFASFL